MQFTEFPLSENLLKGIEEAGYSTCTDVQTEALTHTLEGKDVFVQSQTGTGKTAAFLISLFELIERGNHTEKALIIAPTRELAKQIEIEAILLSCYLDFSMISIYGGVGYYKQEKAIADGVDIVIGTPGRLIDLSNKGTLNLRKYNYVVIDEADRMFDMGFHDDIKKILRRMPKEKIRQTMLFSATLSFNVKLLASRHMDNPEEVLIESKNITVSKINQQLYHVGSCDKMKLLLGILQNHSYNRALIFLNTKQMCEEVAGRLRINGFDADFLTGDLPQNKRQGIINDFKENKLPILVATDVAARGLHINDLELVVNYDIPMHSENYVHRIGRTARAGKSGTAITLACEIFVEYLAPIETFTKMKIPSAVADEELYVDDKSAGKSFRRKRKPSHDQQSRRNSRSTQHSPQQKRPYKKKNTTSQRNYRYDDTSGKRRSGSDDRKPVRIKRAVRKDAQTTVKSTIANKKKEQHITVKPIPVKRKKGFLTKVISFFKS